MKIEIDRNGRIFGLVCGFSVCGEGGDGGIGSVKNVNGFFLDGIFWVVQFTQGKALLS